MVSFGFSFICHNTVIESMAVRLAAAAIWECPKLGHAGSGKPVGPWGPVLPPDPCAAHAAPLSHPASAPSRKITER